MIHGGTAECKRDPPKKFLDDASASMVICSQFGKGIERMNVMRESDVKFLGAVRMAIRDVEQAEANVRFSVKYSVMDACDRLSDQATRACIDLRGDSTEADAENVAALGVAYTALRLTAEKASDKVQAAADRLEAVLGEVAAELLNASLELRVAGGGAR